MYRRTKRWIRRSNLNNREVYILISDNKGNIMLDSRQSDTVNNYENAVNKSISQNKVNNLPVFLDLNRMEKSIRVIGEKKLVIGYKVGYGNDLTNADAVLLLYVTYK